MSILVFPDRFLQFLSYNDEVGLAGNLHLIPIYSFLQNQFISSGLEMPVKIKKSATENLARNLNFGAKLEI